MYHTDKEIFERQKENLHILDLQLAQNRFGIEEIADLLPGVFHLNRMEDVSIQFVNKIGEQYIGLSYQEMIEWGERHIIEHYHPTTQDVIIPQVFEFGKNSDENKVMGYSQLVRRDKDQDYEGFIGFTKVSKELNSFVIVENQVSVFGDLSN